MKKPLTEIDYPIRGGFRGNSKKFRLGHTKCEVRGDILVEMPDKQLGDRNDNQGEVEGRGFRNLSRGNGLSRNGAAYLRLVV